MPKPKISLNDKIAIRKLIIAAPYTFACSSLWYHIAAKYGIGINDNDAVRFRFYQRQGLIGNAKTN
jgi:hypothetical protein